MRHVWLMTPVLALLAVAPTALAAPELTGVYTRVAAESDDIKKAIEASVATMNFVIRPIAHSRLEKTNTPYERLALSIGAKEIAITSDDRPAIVTPANGQAIKWKREDGEVFDVATQLKGDVLEQSFSAEDGKRLNSYRLSPDGKKLTMTVTVSSSKLPKPLTYNQIYRRAK